jgi:hypothetical protein
MNRIDPTDGRDRGWCPVCRRGPFLITKRGELRIHSAVKGSVHMAGNCDGRKPVDGVEVGFGESR